MLSSEQSHAEWEAAKAAINGKGYAELQEVLDLVTEKKAADIVVLSASEIEKMEELCEHMVIVTCMGPRHMKVVAEYVAEHYKLKGMLLEAEDEESSKVTMEPPQPEGQQDDEWVLLDLRNIILHIFSPEGRARYGLEEFWGKMKEGGYTEEEIERMKEEGPDFLSAYSEEELMRDHSARGGGR